MAPKKHWIAQATAQNKGALRRSLGVKEGQTIPATKLRAAANSSNPTTAKRANLALTLKRMRKQG